MKKEVWVWVLLAVAAVSLNYVRLGGPVVSDDSFQYMSIAENLAQGNGIRTSIVHFDTERSHGQIPAPITWFPAGYPAVIALLSLVGIPVPLAGFAVSAISLGALVLVTAWLCSWYRLSVLATRLVLFCLLLNSWALLYGTGVLTESLHTALSVSAMAMLAVAAEQTGKPRQPSRLSLWALCGLTIGLCPWVRYAGLFLYASLGLFVAIDVLFRRRRDLKGPIVASVLATIPTAVLLLRNVSLAGTWRGGNALDNPSSFAFVVKDFLYSGYETIFGELVRERFGAPEVLAALAFGACGLLAAWALFQHRKAIVVSFQKAPSVLPIVTYLTVYLGALAYLSYSSHLGFSYRYCFPVLPLGLVLTGLLVTLITPHLSGLRAGRLAAGAAVVLIACYAFLNLRNTLYPWEGNSIFADRRVTDRLAAPMGSGESLRNWIDEHVPADATIIASYGQPTAYVLQRNTVSLVGHDNSTYNWGQAEMHEVMTRFEANYLILYPDTASHPAAEVQNESQFLSALVRGEALPEWLELAADNNHAKVFRRKELAAGL